MQPDPTYRILLLSFLLPGFLLGTILIAFTFPEFNPVYSPGIDPPLAWVFNYTFHTGNLLGKDFVFPHGPLSFLLYPLPMGHHILIAQATYTLLKFIFFFQVAYLFRLHRPGEWILPFVAVYILFILFEIQFVMLGIIVSGFALYLKTRDQRFAILPVLVAALGIFMRAYITITGSIAILSFLLILFSQTKNYRQPVKLLLVWLAAICLIWLGLYHSFEGLVNYLTGRFYLSVDNSTAVSYYPTNNWVVLSLSLLCLFLIPFVQRSKDVYLYFGFFLLLLFAQWKYSMARQDLIHSRGYFVMLVLFFILLIPHVKKRKFLTFLLALMSLCFYYMNLPNVFGYSEYHVNVVKVNQFAAYMSDFPGLETRWIKQSEDNIQDNRLDDSLKNLIGNKTVDCYPWDYTFIPANGLNWQPRPVIQSYASYTSWLDKKNADHFLSSKAPHFILWHLASAATDPNQSTFETLDNRYPLNDEPQTILSLLGNYTLKARNDRVLLFEKRANPIRLMTNTISRAEVTWNTWTDVPATKGALVRVKAHIHNNFQGTLKSMLYKNEASYILLKTTAGEIYRYRIVAKNAADGIWINPLILHPENNCAEQAVTQIMFTSTNHQMQKDMIPMQWESVKPDQPSTTTGPIQPLTVGANFVLDWFLKNNPEEVKNKLFSLNTILDSCEHWDIHDKRFYTRDFVSPPQSWQMDTNSFSFSFNMNPDSSLLSGCENKTITVSAGVWTKASDEVKADLVISLDEDGITRIYKSASFKDFIADEKNWNYVLNTISIPAEFLQKKNIRLKAYVWNSEKERLLLDDFQVGIK